MVGVAVGVSVGMAVAILDWATCAVGGGLSLGVFVAGGVVLGVGDWRSVTTGDSSEPGR